MDETKEHNTKTSFRRTKGTKNQNQCHPPPCTCFKKLQGNKCTIVTLLAEALIRSSYGGETRGDLLERRHRRKEDSRLPRLYCSLGTRGRPATLKDPSYQSGMNRDRSYSWLRNMTALVNYPKRAMIPEEKGPKQHEESTLLKRPPDSKEREIETKKSCNHSGNSQEWANNHSVTAAPGDSMDWRR